MHVRPIDVDDRRDINRFVRLPFDLYRSEPLWVPPLRRELVQMLDPSAGHPYYAHSTAAFFLAEEEGRPCGRIAVMDNHNFNRHHDARTAFFGLFESVDDQATAAALFGAAADWARARGLDRLIGPRALLPSDSGSVLVEGFQHRPALNVPYNFAYYDRLLTACGFVKEHDSLSGFYRVDHVIPERLLRLAERVKDRRGFRVLHFTDTTAMRPWIPAVGRVYSEAFQANHLFWPPTPAEMDKIANSLLSIADPRLIKLVARGDELVGFIFAYHDLADGLRRARGRLWPLGWLHLLRERRRTEWVDINGVGVAPAFQGLGANLMMYVELAHTIRQFPQFRYGEVILIAEDNLNSRGDQEALGVTWTKRHRTYERAL